MLEVSHVNVSHAIEIRLIRAPHVIHCFSCSVQVIMHINSQGFKNILYRCGMVWNCLVYLKSCRHHLVESTSTRKKHMGQ